MKTSFKKHVTIRFFLLLLPIFLLLLAFDSANLEQKQVRTHQSIVIARLLETNDVQLNNLTAGISKNNQMTFEYSCRQSGIVVIKFAHNYEEKADVQTAVIPKFKEWAKTPRIELIYLDVRKGPSDKC